MTGCVATAMAQVLSVYRYPDRCSGGTFSYHQDDAGIDVSLDFDEVTLNWDAMIDSYAGGVGTAVQKDAVATLMNAVGVAQNELWHRDVRGIRIGTGRRPCAEFRLFTFAAPDATRVV